MTTRASAPPSAILQMGMLSGRRIDAIYASLARRPGETPLAWLGRLGSDHCPYLTDTLFALVDAHYRFAYEPDADLSAIQKEMRDLAVRWRAETAQRPLAA